MKNVSKILCVVLALVMAFSAASCSLTKQYAYQEDDIELPIGVYIYYLYSAYNEAQSLAQQSDLYDSETGKYDGKKSFLKMEITDEDGETAVAEDWIIDKAEENTKHAVGICNKFNELGCTLDEAEIDSTRTYYKSYWDQSYAEMFEQYGVSFESFFEAAYMIPVKESEAFNAEYGTGGPSELSDDDISAFFKENYTSYKYFSVNLYTTATVDEAADSESAGVNVALSEDEINAYKDAFDEYASTLSDGGTYEDVVADYMEKNDIAEDPTTENVEVIDDETTDELLKAIKDMKDSQSMTLEIGEEDSSKQLYLIYREPIEKQLEAYLDPEQKKNDVIKEMKSEDFESLLKDYTESLDITLSSACKSYKPSMFEETKKK